MKTLRSLVAGILMLAVVPVWALETVEAIDQALVQLIEDGSALQHTITKKAQDEIEAADLQALAAQLQAYEHKVEQVVREAKLTLDTVQQPGYDKLLSDSIRLSEVAVGLADGIEQLAAKTQGDSGDQYQNTFETMIHAMLRLSDDIGIMADRILFTEEQIGIMADRIGEMADRILETQRIQNENIARVHDTSNRLIAKLEIAQSMENVQTQANSMRPDQSMLQEQREMMEMKMQQQEAQEQMREMKSQQQEAQEQMRQFRSF